MRSHRFSRRAFLAGAGLLLPQPWAWVWAQSDGAKQLLKVPKVALVIGNAGYKHVSELRNPVKDARAMETVLRECGFDVSIVKDATRQGMQDALNSYFKKLTARQAVGVLYFAGHGVQLAWRNYLLPIDATIAKIEDVPSQCIDVSDLMTALRKSANPMNVVILDACRDNPFGASLRPQQAGLSQMDAPPSTLLAYATAPGNGADDGTGENGLYTGHLVREMRVREARIEDVFKRVRLSVRKESRGAQIPWESTSLEEDFYFHPPAQWVASTSVPPQQTQAAFEAELALWESIKSAPELKPFENYLRQYPSGKFAELAQFRLDTLLEQAGEKRVQLAPSVGNPNTAGTARADTRFKIGDKYAFRTLDLYTGVERSQETEIVTSVSDTEIHFDNGRRILDPLGNEILIPSGRRSTGLQVMGLDYSIGKRWTSRAKVTTPQGMRGEIEINLRVVAKERITVAAGTFDCFKVVGSGYLTGDGGLNTRVDAIRWLAPDQVRVPVVYEYRRTDARGRIIDADRVELVGFSQG